MISFSRTVRSMTASFVLTLFAVQGAFSQNIFWLESQTNVIKKAAYTGTPIAASSATQLTTAGVPQTGSFDKSNNLFYWTDNRTGTIKRVPAGGGAVSDVVTGITATTPEGLYIDITNNFIYWSEKGVGATDRIRRINISGALPKLASAATDVVTGIDIVRGIAVDTGAVKYIYYANAGNNSGGKGIYRVTYTGTAISATLATKLTTAGVVQPQQLFLDRYNNFIYWADYSTAASGNISRVSTATGTVYPAAPVPVLTGQSVRGIYFNALENFMYWAEPKNLRIRKGNVATVPITAPVDVVTGLGGLPRNIVYANVDRVVPVKFISARAYPAGKFVTVEWDVASELNMSHYIVERSADAVNFTTAGTIAVSGNNNIQNHYHLDDYNFLSGESWYRIIGVSNNGARDITPLMKVNIGGQLLPAVTVFPNPVIKGTDIRLQIQDIDKASYEIALFNNAGSRLMSQQYNHNGGSSFISLKTPTLPAGVYMLRVQNGQQIFTQNVVVQ